MIPTAAEKAMLPMATPRETVALRSMAFPIGPTTRAAKPSPIKPPRMVRTIDSIKNWVKILRRVAPKALRRPISRVRSVTETYMMFITPIPPTNNEIPAIAPTTVVMVPKIVFT